MQIAHTARLASWVLGFASTCLALPSAHAGEHYRDQRLGDLTFVEGDPSTVAVPGASLRFGAPSEMRPYAVLDGGGEAFVHARDAGELPATWRDLALSVRVGDSPEDVSGRLFLPRADGIDVLRFRMSAESAAEGAGEAFLRAKRDHYDVLLRAGVPGAAWFRHERDSAARALPEVDGGAAEQRPAAGGGELEDSYALFSGGRALAENLQLDRELPPDGGAGANIPIESLEGITIKEFDWSALVEGLEPELDPLASLIPADQHAVFFPDLPSLIEVLDEATLNGTPVLDLLQPKSEDAHTRERYETQLCLPLDVWARTLGPLAVGEIAITGSDPYLRSGADVAVLLAARDVDALEAFLAARRKAALSAGEHGDAPVLGTGTLRDVDWQSAVSSDRRVSSYAARVDETLVVTNSLAQLERILETAQGGGTALASSPEYVFFRARYPRGDALEQAFVLLTDATIRRWCSPRWRIGVARRTWQTALAAEEYAGELAKASAAELQDGGWRVPMALEFQTPVLELDVARVTPAERDAYSRFRDRYQSNWRAFFDPIAIRVGVDDERASADVSVWPLIEATDYDEVFSFSRGARFDARAGDPHADAVSHLILGINKESPAFRSFGSWAGAFGSDFGANPFSWLGDSIAVYADDDPFWEEWRAAAAEDDRDVFLEDEFYRLPVVARLSVSDPLKLTAFLTSLRTLSNQAAPNMVVWENRTHADVVYVRIAPAVAMGQVTDKAELFYAPTPDALLITLNEEALQRALERRANRSAADGELLWLGESAGLRLDARAVDWIRTVWSDEWTRRAQRLSWGNLSALNEWRRRYPGSDAVELHERLWGPRLRCPGGGRYEWREDWQTHVSSVYGHPAAPTGARELPPALSQLLSLSFGLTFEDEGLRARAELTRAAAK